MRKHSSLMALAGLLAIAQPVEAIAQASPAEATTVSAPATTDERANDQAEQERLNREQADFSMRQLAENEANKSGYQQAVQEREATIARQQAEYEAAVAAAETERLRLVQEHEAAMARWRADVEACEKGDRSRCAKDEPTAK